LSTEAQILLDKFSALLRWERRKRRERICAAASCYALAAALLALPFNALLRAAWSRWIIPIVLFAILAPIFLFQRRWHRADSARALARVDQALGLEERAITAWELIERGDARPAAQLVLKQAAERLNTLDPRSLFRRRWHWHHILTLPLLVVWLALMWFGIDRQFSDGLLPPATPTTAHKLREYSRELQERAKSEGLRESLGAGKELEKVAQKGIDANTTDDQFKDELAAASRKIEAMEKSAADQPLFQAGGSQQSLRDLKAELEAARELLKFPEAATTEEKLTQQWLDRLAGLPQLKRQFDKENQAGQRLGQNALQSFLDRLDKQATGELDRRTLLEAQQYLEQLMKQGQGERGEQKVRAPAAREQDGSGDGEKLRTHSNLPGKEPGRKDEGFQSLPEFPAGAPARVKGALGEGESSGVMFKGKPVSSKSELPQQEVIATYRRQAEAELNSERVPEALKETIKNYFMSLGANETKK
jgi:hypothetical protein